MSHTVKDLRQRLETLQEERVKLDCEIFFIEDTIFEIENSKTCDICGATFLCPSNDGKVHGANFEELGPIVRNGKTITFVCAKCLAPMFAKEMQK